MERLTFNAGTPTRRPLVVIDKRVGVAAPPARPALPSRFAQTRRRVAAVRERYDWDYVWMLAFTAVVFFRPQDQGPGLAALHLGELTPIAGLAAMAIRRMSAGETILSVNPELVGVLVLGAVVLLSVPFSIWPGGSLRVFSDIYVKIILVFALMMTTVTSAKRLRQVTWLMVIASGYIAARGVFDYARGVNLVEGDRLSGAVGGMFGNPNDLAMNLVTFLAPTLFIIFHDRKTSRRLFAALLAVIMLAGIVFTKSRGGFLGLLAMFAVAGYYVAKAKPGIIFAGALAVMLAMPAMPASFWARMDSIGNAETDPSGSRAARIRLLTQGVQVFVDNPITGIGAGQFMNYDGPGMIERWRVTHNVWLQVAAELGIFGLAAFAFLVYRAFAASYTAMRELRPRRSRRTAARALRRPAATRAGPAARRSAAATGPALSEGERHIVEINAKSMLAGLTGWFVCAFFASVA